VGWGGTAIPQALVLVVAPLMLVTGGPGLPWGARLLGGVARGGRNRRAGRAGATDAQRMRPTRRPAGLRRTG
jgi:hypothetical protein